MKYLLIGLLFFFSQTLYSGFQNCKINPQDYDIITFMNSNGTYELPTEELYMVNFKPISVISIEIEFIASIRLDSENVEIFNRPIAMIYRSIQTPRRYFVEIYFSNFWNNSELEPCEVGEITIS